MEIRRERTKSLAKSNVLWEEKESELKFTYVAEGYQAKSRKDGTPHFI